MRNKIFDQICFRRTELLQGYYSRIVVDKVWQFIECDVALLLKERAELRKLLLACKIHGQLADSNLALYEALEEMFNEEEKL